MATGGVGTDQLDNEQPGPSGLTAGRTEPTGGPTSETSSLASTIVPLPIPKQRTSRPTTPTLHHRPTPSPRSLRNEGEHPEMEPWALRVDRAFQDADDLVLPYLGKRMQQARIDSVRTEADRIGRTLRDCYPYCDAKRQAKIVQYRKSIVEVSVGLEEMSTESDSGSSQRQDEGLPTTPAGRSTPRSYYVPPGNQIPPVGSRECGGNQDGAKAPAPGQSNAPRNNDHNRNQGWQAEPPGQCEPPRGSGREDNQHYRNFSYDRYGDQWDRDRYHDRGYSYSRNRSPSPPNTALEFERQSVVFQLGLIADDALPDVEDGSELDPRDHQRAVRCSGS